MAAGLRVFGVWDVNWSVGVGGIEKEVDAEAVGFVTQRVITFCMKLIISRV